VLLDSLHRCALIMVTSYFVSVLCYLTFFNLPRPAATAAATAATATA